MASINITDLQSISKMELDNDLQELSEQELNLLGGFEVAFVSGDKSFGVGIGFSVGGRSIGVGIGIGGLGGALSDMRLAVNVTEN